MDDRGEIVEVGPSVNGKGTCDDLGVDFDVNLKVMCRNVCGRSNLDHNQDQDQEILFNLGNH